MKFRLFLTVLALSLSACATKPRVPQFPVLPPERHEVVGQVVLVNRSFAMIRTGADLAPDTELQSRSAKDDSATATLRVSGEKIPPHVIVDIMKGKPFPGEMVTRLVE